MDESIRRRSCKELPGDDARTFPVVERLLGPERFMLLESVVSGASWALVQYTACVLNKEATATVRVLCSGIHKKLQFRARLMILLPEMDDTRIEIVDGFEDARFNGISHVVVDFLFPKLYSTLLSFDNIKFVRSVMYYPTYVDEHLSALATSMYVPVLRANMFMLTRYPPVPLSPIVCAIEALAEAYTTRDAETEVVVSVDVDAFLAAVEEQPMAADMHTHIATMTKNIGSLSQQGLFSPLPHSIAMAVRLDEQRTKQYFLFNVRSSHVISDAQLLYEYTTRNKRLLLVDVVEACYNAIAANDIFFARLVLLLYPEVRLVERLVDYARMLNRRAILDDLLAQPRLTDAQWTKRFVGARARR